MIVPAAITRRRIDKVDAEIERPVQGRNRLIVIGRSVRAGHAHATKRQMRNFKLRRAELNVFHDSSVRSRQLPQLKLASQSVIGSRGLTPKLINKVRIAGAVEVTPES